MTGLPRLSILIVPDLLRLPLAPQANWTPMQNVSIVIPARNEAHNLAKFLPRLCELCDGAEIIVVDDGSSDNTVSTCQFPRVKVLSHKYSMGNGAAIKTGARAATRDILVCIDGDGQHRPEDIPLLLDKLAEGYDMVIGARSWRSQAGMTRAIGNRLYNALASWMTGHKIEDLTSGFRVMRAKNFRRFLYLLPNGFSYPTTITMAFFRSAYAVAYVPVTTNIRQGQSNIRIMRDGIRFFIIILRIGSLFSPMRLFLPVSLFFFLLGLIHYAYTFLTSGRFTNMGALLFIAAMLTFLIGIVSEQIAALHYKESSNDRH